MTVGDAQHRLEGEGLLESRPRVGAQVRIPMARSISGHCILREALESQAASMFEEKASPEEPDEIARMAHQLDALHVFQIPRDVSAQDLLFEIHRFHMRFHLRIAECASCGGLCQAIIKNQVFTFSWLYGPALRNQSLPAAGHSYVAEVLEAGGPEQADAAMRRHARCRMEEVLAQMEPYFRRNDSRVRTFSITSRRHGQPQVAAAPETGKLEEGAK